jgi:hypothetical protein
MRRAPWSVDHALVCVELMAHWATALIAAAPPLTAAAAASSFSAVSVPVSVPSSVSVPSVSVSVPSSVSVSSPSSDSVGVAAPVAGHATAAVPALAAAVAHASAVLLQSDASPSPSPSLPPSSSPSSTTVMPVSESSSSAALLSTQQQQHLRDALAPLVRRRRFIHGTAFSSPNAHSTQARWSDDAEAIASAAKKQLRICSSHRSIFTRHDTFFTMFARNMQKMLSEPVFFIPAMLFWSAVEGCRRLAETGRASPRGRSGAARRVCE